ncbi:MAG TPA: hypothetical protein VM513_35075 [Kofleriaceae bacterium]|nr:hypothetical protein [Kofleriaceae bacterium]
MWTTDRSPRILTAAATVLAVLLALAAAGGIWLPSVYARETPSWTAQGTGQDWIDLVVVAPLLGACAVWLRRSRAWQLLFGGALGYLIYSFVLYAFAMHFNALFLVYCAVLGVASYALLGLAIVLRRDQPAPAPRLASAGGWFLIVTGVAFYALWLSSVVPALIAGEPPAELAEVGLITNPVHVLDLALVLPALILAGISLRRRRPLAATVGPIAMTFNTLMSLALVGMMLAMRARGVPTDAAVTAVLAVMCAISAALLATFLRPATRRSRDPNRSDRTSPACTSPLPSSAGR